MRRCWLYQAGVVGGDVLDIGQVVQRAAASTAGIWWKHKDFPAVHWFTIPQLSQVLRDAGPEVFSRLGLMRPEQMTGARAFLRWMPPPPPPPRRPARTRQAPLLPAHFRRRALRAPARALIADPPAACTARADLVPQARCRRGADSGV